MADEAVKCPLRRPQIFYFFAPAIILGGPVIRLPPRLPAQPLGQKMFLAGHGRVVKKAVSGKNRAALGRVCIAPGAVRKNFTGS